MTKFKISVIIDKPVEVITKALENAQNFPYWQTDLVKFEVIKGEANQAGAVARLHYRQKGHPYIMEDRLIFCEPGKKYISEVTGDALTAKVETTLRSLESKTEMTLEWSGRGKLLFLKLVLPILRGKLVKQSKKELKTFKHLVETRGDDFSKSSRNTV